MYDFIRVTKGFQFDEAFVKNPSLSLSRKIRQALFSFKGHLRSKKKVKLKCKGFSRYSISKSGIWARWISPFCRFSASFSIKYDVTDAILQDNEKMKVQYLRSLLFDLFETLHAVRAWQRNSASFQILLLWQPE